MSAPGTPQIPAGWYPDPQAPGQGRFWDGTAWTDHVHVPGQPMPVAELTAPAGTDTNTPWIWLLIGIPLLPMLLLLGVPWASMFDIDVTDPYAASTASLAIFVSPFYWAAVLAGWAVYGVSVLFAYRDHAELTRRGVPRPFHWAFVFIGGTVYVIGRSIVVRRRTGRPQATLWAQIAVIALSLVVMIVILVLMFSGMAEMFGRLAPYGR